MRISDWSSDVCSSDLLGLAGRRMGDGLGDHGDVLAARNLQRHVDVEVPALADHADCIGARVQRGGKTGIVVGAAPGPARHAEGDEAADGKFRRLRSEDRRVGKGRGGTYSSRWSPPT